jgi:spore maturation protein CgeB
MPEDLERVHFAVGVVVPAVDGPTRVVEPALVPREAHENWGDGERSAELHEFLLGPARSLGLRGHVHGVRYPREAADAVREAGLSYEGWLPNHRAPEAFARHRVTVHVPRRAYVRRVPGVPTIRVFEALACGIPLVCSPWEDRERLFRPGTDYLVARDGDEMAAHLRALVADPDRAARLAANGLETVRARHTCAPRRRAARDRGGHLAMRISFFGSSLVSAYWNGACTYYRGIVRALAARGHEVTFYEPDALDRQRHRDIPDPDWARVVVYEVPDELAVRETVERAGGADVVVKASGVGVFDDVLEEAVLATRRPDTRVLLWDVDAPATLTRLERDPSDPLRALVPEYDLVLTYGGGERVVGRYESLGARRCIPIYNALDPDTHHPVPPRDRFRADLSALVNRLPDREARVEEFFFRAVDALPRRSFVLGGAGWEDRVGQPNLSYLGHVPPGSHNAFNCSPLAVLNVTRDSMVANGSSPPTRVFEAAGAGACVITDEWEGVGEFLTPGEQVIVCASGADVASVLDSLDPAEAARIGARARERMLDEHTYARRAVEVERALALEASRCA